MTDDQEDDDAGGSTRREALRKALAAAAVGGAVFVAPRIDGFSIVPDYAQAGTALTGENTFRLNGFDEPGSTDGAKASPTPFIVAPTPTSPSKNATITMVGSLGLAGNATLRFGAGSGLPNNVDDGPLGASVTFDVDPPFNKCRVSSAVVQWDPGTNQTMTISPQPNPNTTSPFTVNVNSIDAPTPTTGINFIEVKVRCD